MLWFALCRRYAYVAQGYYQDTIAAIDLEAGSAAPSKAATIRTAPGGSNVDNVVALCGSGRQLYASEWLPAHGMG